MEIKNVIRESENKHFYISMSQEGRTFYSSTKKSKGLLIYNVLSLSPYYYYQRFSFIYSMFCQWNYSLDMVYTSEIFISAALLVIFPWWRMSSYAQLIFFFPHMEYGKFPNWVASLSSLYSSPLSWHLIMFCFVL